MRKQNRHSGFTLIEMLLVLVIAGMILYLLIGYVQQRSLSSRIDRVSTQMQQILNAGLAYYVVNGSWPPNLNCLKGLGGINCTGTVQYLPTTIKSPWGLDYEVSAPSSSGRPPVLFYVYTPITSAGITTGTASAAAQTIAGKLPLSYTSGGMSVFGSSPSASTLCTASTTNCYVVASVNIPGQNLNNAPAVNFAGIYKHGGCVPVPSCPVDSRGNTMIPQIMVVPVSVSGMNDPNSNNVYPISSFTAYASGPPSSAPPACGYGGTMVPCDAQNAVPNATYWRVCLQVRTDKGLVSETNQGGSSSSTYPYYPWGGNVTLMAITRCSISNEPSGSDLNVFSQ